MTLSLIRYQSLAAEFDRKLASAESLLHVARWYAAQYHDPANCQLRLDHGDWNCSDTEQAALGLSLADFKSEAEIATRDCACARRRGGECTCFIALKASREGVGLILTDDLEGFEMRVDRFRRYAAAAIRDRSICGDEVAVKTGRFVFLFLCEQGINAAERLGNYAYANMLRHQCERFNRVLSDQAPPVEEEDSRLLPLPPVDLEADRRVMPAHEWVVGGFLRCAAAGMSFFEAVDSFKTFCADRADSADSVH
jgi:hypothetical protein